MIHLYMREGIHLDELARFYKVNRATVTRAIRKLEQEGYVHKIVDKTNSKAYKLHVSQKGFAARESIMNAFNGWINLVTAGFTEKEISIAVHLIRRMAVNTSAYEGDVVL